MTSERLAPQNRGPSDKDSMTRGRLNGLIMLSYFEGKFFVRISDAASLENGE